MGRKKSTSLEQLIETLTKTEKKHFKLYASTFKKDSIYFKMFVAIEKASRKKGLDDLDDQILSQFPQVKQSHLSSYKSQLFNHILRSLVIMHSQNIPSISIAFLQAQGKILRERKMKKEAIGKYSMALSLAKELDLKYAEAGALKEVSKLFYSQDLNHSLSLIDREKGVLKGMKRENNLRQALMELHRVYFKFPLRERRRIVPKIQKKISSINEDELSGFWENMYYLKLRSELANEQKKHEEAASFNKAMIRVFEKNDKNKAIYVNDYLDILRNEILFNTLLCRYEPIAATYGKVEEIVKRPPSPTIDIVVALTNLVTSITLAFLKIGAVDRAQESFQLFEQLEKHGQSYKEHIKKEGMVLLVKTIFLFVTQKYKECIPLMNRATLLYQEKQEMGFREGIIRIIRLLCYYEQDKPWAYDFFIQKNKKTILETEKALRELLKKILLNGLDSPEKYSHLLSFKEKFSEMKQKLPASEHGLFNFIDLNVWAQSKIDGVSFLEGLRKKHVTSLKALTGTT